MFEPLVSIPWEPTVTSRVLSHADTKRGAQARWHLWDTRQQQHTSYVKQTSGYFFCQCPKCIPRFYLFLLAESNQLARLKLKNGRTVYFQMNVLIVFGRITGRNCERSKIKK